MIGAIHFLFYVSTSLSGAAVPVVNPHPGMGLIAVAGDSLAFGYGAQDWSFTPESCLGDHFQAPTKNYSIVAATSSSLEKRLPRILQDKPKLVFISSGGNDVITNHFGSYPVQKSLDEMRRVFDALIAEGALVVYLGLNPPYAGAERLPMISIIAAAKGVIVVDGMNGFWGTTQWLTDGIHPNDAGYQLLCTRLLQAVSPYYP